MDAVDHPAKKIKFLMRSYNTTVQALADKVGIPLESLRDILDEREVPTSSLLRRMCNFFGVGDNFFSGMLQSDPSKEEARQEGEMTALRRAIAAGKERASADAERRQGRPGKLRSHRKLDLAEVAARQQVILDLLLSKNVFTRDEYETRLEILRAKVIARKHTR